MNCHENPQNIMGISRTKEFQGIPRTGAPWKIPYLGWYVVSDYKLMADKLSKLIDKNYNSFPQLCAYSNYWKTH